MPFARADVSSSRPFGWPDDEIPDPQAAETFERSRLDWEERSAPSHARILDWHRRLIGLRRELPRLAAAAWPEVAFDANAGWISVKRNGTLLIANIGSAPAHVPLPAGPELWRIEVASYAEITLETGDEEGIWLPAMSVALLLEQQSAAGT